jgi:hypothetical protein
MKIQKARRFNKADYPDAPEWMEPIFQVLNTQFERLVTLLQNNITFGDNFRAEVITLDLEHGKTTPIKLNVLKRNPRMGLFVGSNYFSAPEFTWENAEETLTVNVKVEWKEPPDDVVRSTLLFVGE